MTSLGLAITFIGLGGLGLVGLWYLTAHLRNPEMNPMSTEKRTLTCVYCGMAYPEGTPPHSADVLTSHIRICEKHPMRKCEEERSLLRAALVRLVGADGKAELDGIRVVLTGVVSMGSADAEAAIQGVDALLATLPDPGGMIHAS